jgi:hypothetical protein
MADRDADFLEHYCGLTGTVLHLSTEVECTGRGGRKRPWAYISSPRFCLSSRHAGDSVPQVLPWLDGSLMFADDCDCGYLEIRLSNQRWRARKVRSGFYRGAV